MKKNNFKIGEKVVYVNKTIYDNFPIKEYNVYTINNIVRLGIQLEGFDDWVFLSDRFISLSKYRKQKIEKILKN